MNPTGRLRAHLIEPRLNVFFVLSLFNNVSDRERRVLPLARIGSGPRDSVQSQAPAAGVAELRHRPFSVHPRPILFAAPIRIAPWAETLCMRNWPSSRPDAQRQRWISRISKGGERSSVRALPPAGRLAWPR